MNFNQALITCLVLIAFISAAVQKHKPYCTPEVSPNTTAIATHFLIYIDRTLAKPLLDRLIYLLKSITCEIPLRPNIKVLVMSGFGQESTFSDGKSSLDIMEFLYSGQHEANDEPNSDSCERFRRALGRAPPAYLEHPNVQFLVPIVGDETKCSMIGTFQQYYKNSPLKKNINFNGILINSNLTEENSQSVRTVVSNIETEIDLDRARMNYAANISDLYEIGPMIQNYTIMLMKILDGSLVPDWESTETTTTLLPSTTTLASTTTSANLTTIQVLQKTEEAEDENIGLVDAGGVENTTIVSSTASSTVILNTTASENLTSTTSSMSTTDLATTTTVNSTITVLPLDKRGLEAESTTTDVITTSDTDYDFVESNNPFEVVQASSNSSSDGLRGNLTDANTTTTRAAIDADIMMWLIIILLIIWLLCVILCLIWMFYCAQRKVDDIEDEAEETQRKLEEQMPLLEKGPDPCSTKSAEEKEEEDEEWKKIKPADYSAPAPSKSETESVHQPEPAARYQPVEVSELEANNDDEFDQKPRRGYVPAKKTAPLQFD